jgi:uncharacterized protein (TIGR03437 family)
MALAEFRAGVQQTEGDPMVPVQILERHVVRPVKGTHMKYICIASVVMLLARGALAPLPAQTLGGCAMFPADNIWNTPIDTLPVSSHSAAYINSIGPSTGLHADFGSGTSGGEPIGIPYALVTGSQSKVNVTFEYADESDSGPYPIPANAPIEGGSRSTGDRHVLLVDTTNCILYELYAAYPKADGTWQAGSGAIFDLKRNQLRPQGWTSADAAGLPIVPGLVRYDEILAGEINHAIRFTVQVTQKAYLWPARHYASANTATSVPPMGARFRLKSTLDVSGFPREVQIILKAMKKYGIIVADNGSNWYVSGVPDDRWDNDNLAKLRNVHGSDFEAIDESGLMIDVNSAQVPTGLSPSINAGGVVNAGSYTAPVVPGSIAAAFGGFLLSSPVIFTQSPLPTSISGLSIRLGGGTPAPLFSVAGGQVNFQVPWELTGQSQTTLAAILNGYSSAAQTVRLAPFAPAIFSINAEGSGQGAILNAAYYPVDFTHPATAGSTVILIYCTGLGAVTSQPASGSAAPLTSLSYTTTNPTVTIGGAQADNVSFSGLAPGYVGLYQVNAQVPAGSTKGTAVPVTISIGGATSNAVTIAVQ